MDLLIEDIFEEFTKAPFASASMGQAHHAKLKNGDTVVVKVQHPNIAEEIMLDLQLFERALPLIKYIPETSVVDLNGVLQEVRRSLTNELDFLKKVRMAYYFMKRMTIGKRFAVQKSMKLFVRKK